MLIKGIEKYDHPEHFDDIIREYNSDQRYIPSPLKDLLLDQCGHRCTICDAPYCEIHHIIFMEKGGPTEYENLIVLCPNCHTRVHSEDVPSKEQLKQYKLKLEIVYSLPIISKLTKNEKDLIKEISSRDSNNEILKFNKRYYEEVPASSQEEAKQIFRDKIGYFNLELADIIKSEYGMVVTSASGKTVGVNLYIRATSKAAKWISYLRQTNRLIFLD